MYRSSPVNWPAAEPGTVATPPHWMAATFEPLTGWKKKIIPRFYLFKKKKTNQISSQRIRLTPEMREPFGIV